MNVYGTERLTMDNLKLSYSCQHTHWCRTNGKDSAINLYAKQMRFTSTSFCVEFFLIRFNFNLKRILLSLTKKTKCANSIISVGFELKVCSVIEITMEIHFVKQWISAVRRRHIFGVCVLGWALVTNVFVSRKLSFFCLITFRFVPFCVACGSGV